MLDASVAGDDVTIDWEQIEDDVTADVLGLVLVLAGAGTIALGSVASLLFGAVVVLVGLLVLPAAARPRGGVISLRPWRRWDAR